MITTEQNNSVLNISEYVVNDSVSLDIELSNFQGYEFLTKHLAKSIARGLVITFTSEVNKNPHNPLEQDKQSPDTYA